MNENTGSGQQPEGEQSSPLLGQPSTMNDTVPLTSEVSYPAAVSEAETHRAPQPDEQHTSKKASGLFAGIAIGAVIGAIAGGATASVVAVNSFTPETQTVGASELTIKNPESTTQVSAIAEVATPSTVTIEVSSPSGAGAGSGAIYSKDGYIITNAHVVTMDGGSAADTTIRVLLSDGRIVAGSIVGIAPYADIAVIKIEADNLTPMKIAETPVSVGDLTVAIGAPFELSNTVTSGVVSTLYRGISVSSQLIPTAPNQPEEPEQSPYDFHFDTPGQPSAVGGQVTLPVIQTDASINPGNSGGPLLNSAGELIGINVAIASAGQTQEKAGSVGLGFAIPVKLAMRVAESIIDGQPATHGLLGATVLDSLASSDSTQRGGLIRDVISGSAAEKGGLQPGDIIVAVDGVATSDGTTVSAMIRYFEGGSEVTLDVVRGTETLTKDVTLGTLTIE